MFKYLFIASFVGGLRYKLFNRKLFKYLFTCKINREHEFQFQSTDTGKKVTDQFHE
jgi:hypothetical protein